jgi:hypothetical protein
MTKPPLGKVEALLYVLQHVTTKGCARIMTHPPKNPWPQNPLQKTHTQKKITKNLHSKKNSSNFASLFQKMESTQFGM